MSRLARTLPLRVPPVPGEAIDSWLEALARRSQVTVGTLTAALGWPVPATPPRPSVLCLRVGGMLHATGVLGSSGARRSGEASARCPEVKSSRSSPPQSLG